MNSEGDASHLQVPILSRPVGIILIFIIWYKSGPLYFCLLVLAYKEELLLLFRNSVLLRRPGHAFTCNLFLSHVVLGIKLRVLHTPDKHSITSLEHNDLYHL